MSYFIFFGKDRQSLCIDHHIKQTIHFPECSLHPDISHSEGDREKGDLLGKYIGLREKPIRVGKK